MARRHEKRPEARTLPPDRKGPRTSPGRDPALHDRETIVWGFSSVDQEGPWGWRTVAARDWWNEILPKEGSVNYISICTRLCSTPFDATQS